MPVFRKIGFAPGFQRLNCRLPEPTKSIFGRMKIAAWNRNNKKCLSLWFNPGKTVIEPYLEPFYFRKLWRIDTKNFDLNSLFDEIFKALWFWKKKLKNYQSKSQSNFLFPENPRNYEFSIPYQNLIVYIFRKISRQISANANFVFKKSYRKNYCSWNVFWQKALPKYKV